MQPVWVGLQGGGNTISRQALDIISAAPGFPAAATPDANGESNLWNRVTGGNTVDRVAGQQVLAQRLLPGKLTLIHPVTTRFITSRFGWRKNPTGAGHQTHIGQDYGVACGSPVYATSDGTVVLSAWAGHSGMRVTIEHGSSVRTGYSHNSKLIARVGDFVKKGQVIALSGTTGNSTGCHVHFEVIINGRWVDPSPYLPGANGLPGLSLNAGQTTAEPVRNDTTQGPMAQLGHDIELDLPGKTESKKAGKKPADPGPGVEPAVKAPPKPTTKPTPKPTPAPAPTTKPKPAPGPTTTPTPKPSPEPKPETAPKPETSPKPPPTPTPTPETKPKPTPTPETKPKPTPTPETSPEPVPEPSPEDKSPDSPAVDAPTPPTEAKPRPAPNPSPEPAPKPSPKPAPSPEASAKPTSDPAPSIPVPSEDPESCDPELGLDETVSSSAEQPCLPTGGNATPKSSGIATPPAREEQG